MCDINPPSLSSRLTAAYHNRNRDEFLFWTLAKMTIERTASRYVREDDLDEVVQRTLIVTYEGLARFQMDPRHDEPDGNTSLLRWLRTLAKRQALDLLREQKRARELPISQIGSFRDGQFHGIELEYLRNSTAVTQFMESSALVEDEERFAQEDATTAALDAFRELLSADDQRIFDLYREGVGGYEIAQHLGIGEDDPYTKLRTWRRLAARIEKNKAAVARLERLRDQLSEKDQQLLGLLSKGITRIEAARICNRNPTWPSMRLAAWRKMVTT